MPPPRNGGYSQETMPIFIDKQPLSTDPPVGDPDVNSLSRERVNAKGALDLEVLRSLPQNAAQNSKDLQSTRAAICSVCRVQEDTPSNHDCHMSYSGSGPTKVAIP